MKVDEYRLLKAFQQCHTVGMPSPQIALRELAQSLGVNQKRAAYLAQKWADKGWYNCGVNILLGWLEPAGLSIRPERTMANDSEEKFHVGLGLMLTRKEIDMVNEYAKEVCHEHQPKTDQSGSEGAGTGSEDQSVDCEVSQE